MNDAIGDRMKENYENRYRIKLTRRTPVILRLDGKAFHTLTRGCERPFDQYFQNAMETTAQYLCQEIQGAKVSYTQSDEISILLIDYDRLSTDAWFDYNLQKMVSVAASMASAVFNSTWPSNMHACFDCRAFNVPREDVTNYFVWRQQDWTRNSLQSLAQAHFSHKQLHGKNQVDLHDMLHEKGVNWAELDLVWKNGTTVYRLSPEAYTRPLSYEESGWHTSHDIKFKLFREVIESWLEVDKNVEED